MKCRARVALLCVAAAGFAACRADSRTIGVPMNDRTRWEAEWRTYGRLAGEKALAYAGDINGQFVTGVARGQATQAEAVKAALDECAQRRSDRRLDDECRLYAIGDEIVIR